MRKNMRERACLSLLLASCWSATPLAAAAPALDCSAEAAILSRDQSELPRLDVASPTDPPPYCITLETIMAFAGRVRAHVAHCPNSEHAVAVADWDKTRTDYSKLFSRHRCRRTL